MAESNGLINKFFNFKTIQKAYNFYVEIDNMVKKPDMFVGKNKQLSKFEDYGSFPVTPHHVKSATLPGYQTKLEMYRVGNMVSKHPMFDVESSLLKIDFAEDSENTIQQFILWLTKRRMTQFGKYFTITDSSPLNITVYVTNDEQKTVAKYAFHKCAFVNATEPTYGYETSEGINISIDFSFKYIDTEFFN